VREDGKPEGLRQSMSWLHTYSGLVLGWLLYAVFFTGTLSYFRDEINDWMRPELHAGAQDEYSAQRALDAMQRIAPQAESWNIALPGARKVALEASWREPGAQVQRGPGGRVAQNRVYLDPASGAQLPAPRESRASNFFYRFHFELHAIPRTWGRWIVGITTMLMFVAIISGVITHKKIFSDFFTFRPKKGQRSWLDAHNATAVLALPFHVMITFSGLLLLAYTVMPWTSKGVYGSGAATSHVAEVRAERQAVEGAPGGRANPAPERPTARERPGRRGQAETGIDTTAASVAPRERSLITLAPLEPMLAEFNRHWPTRTVGSISVSAPGSERPIVVLNEAGGSSLIKGTRGQSLRFDGASGALLGVNELYPPSFARATRSVFTALHEGRFADPLMRWLLFAGGVLGTFMVASGLVLWVVKRLPERRKSGYTPLPHRLVEVLNVGTIGGLSVAVASVFWLNRLLPASMATRADWEIRGFFILWLACILHPLLCRHRTAWLQQMAVATLAYLLLPVLNALTGGNSLLRTPAFGQWSIASIDLIALVLAALHGTALWWMLRSGKTKLSADPMRVKRVPAAIVAREAEPSPERAA